jgi:hypothetical protein
MFQEKKSDDGSYNGKEKSDYNAGNGRLFHPVGIICPEIACNNHRHAKSNACCKNNKKFADGSTCPNGCIGIFA